MARPGTNAPPRALEHARRARVVKPADERRRELLAAAERLFGERGYDMTTVQAVAAAAGVAAGTVYLYFPSKEAILAALHEDFEAGLIDRFAAVADEVLREEDATGDVVTYQETIERIVDGLVAYSLERRALAQVIARHVGRGVAVPDGSILSGALTDVLAQVIREGVRLGYVHTTDPEMAAYLLNLAATAAIGNAIALEDDAMIQRAVRSAKELFVKALAPEAVSE